MTKRIVIHAGPGKTGTSAIQHWLNSNRETLSSEGIYYPEHQLDANNVSSGNLYSIYDRLTSGMLALNTQKLLNLKRDFENRTESILLLSSEFFFLRVVELLEVFPEAEFIFYLRNPIELFESNYNQGVKRQQNTEPFRLPERVNFKVFSVLGGLLEHDKNIKITIRPYSKKEFYKGNIVNDFLNILSVGSLKVETTKINSSYSLEALEFKRNANFFLEGSDAIELDLALQAYNLGEFNYSLITPAKFTKQKTLVLKQLDGFIDKYDLSHLISFRDELSSLNQKNYKKQSATLGMFNSVLTYIKQEHPNTFNKLNKQVRSNINYILPFQEFYSLFDVDSSMRECDEKLEDHKALASTLLTSSIKKPADVCREIGLFLEQKGQTSLANEFFETAYSIDPKRPLIIRKINAYYQSVFKSNEDKPKTSNIKQKLKNTKKRFFSGKSSKS
ncbi:hypothetical protein [Shewanella japonica]|uniref:hypothetical protein n=1 Tax=Shewanella japonica TaxID=93973 RepID=UPI00249407E4|nr:hypothetical protein [Shewanella japonica]